MFLLTLSVRFRVRFRVGGTSFSNALPTQQTFNFQTASIQTTNQHITALPDSHSSLSFKTECAFSATHWTFHFDSVVKRNEQGTVISLCRNVTTLHIFPISQGCKWEYYAMFHQQSVSSSGLYKTCYRWTMLSCGYFMYKQLIL